MATTNQMFQRVKRPDNRTLTFTMSGTRVSYANTLRRAVQTEVQILGFRADMQEDGSTADVKIIKNSTPMSNEMLADRVGLLPIYNDTSVTWEKDAILFKLHVKNETSDYKYITASDFECLKKNEEGDVERIPNTKFFRPDPITAQTCLLAVLKPFVEGQEPEEIHIEAHASLGKGKEHTRFNPTSQCSYAYTRDENPARILELWQKWLVEQKKADPAELDKPEHADRKKILENEFRSLEINRCFKVGDDGEANSFDFVVESVGMMDPYEILLRAFTAVTALASKYASLSPGKLPDNLEVRPSDGQMRSYDFVFTGEDHTLGNLLQTWLDDNKVNAGPEKGGVLFAGYCIPHPLRNEMVLRIATEDGKEKTACQVVAEAAKGCADMFAEYGSEFVAVNRDAPTVWEAHKEVKGLQAAKAAATKAGQKKKAV